MVSENFNLRSIILFLHNALLMAPGFLKDYRKFSKVSAL